jgi:hypothetical protein
VSRSSWKSLTVNAVSIQDLTGNAIEPDLTLKWLKVGSVSIRAMSARSTPSASSKGRHTFGRTIEEDNLDQLSKTVSHNFPDFIEFWDRDVFRKVGYGLGSLTAFSAAFPAAWYSFTNHPVTYLPALALGALTAVYWKVGEYDMKQTSHALLRNFPVLGHVRYVFESIRPEIRQYFIESDSEGRPFSRLHRAQVYQRGNCKGSHASLGMHSSS